MLDSDIRYDRATLPNIVGPHCRPTVTGSVAWSLRSTKKIIS